MSYILGYHEEDFSFLITLLEKYPSVQGILFFQRNIESLTKFAKKISFLKSIKPSLKFCVDFEGGKVNRFRHLGSYSETAFILGSHYHGVLPQSRQSVKYRLFQQLTRVAKLYQEIGLTTVFGPCIDPLGISSVIARYERSYSINTEIIKDLSSVFIEVFLDYGIECVIKHYPSHGQALGDSHYQCALDVRSLCQIKKERDLYTHLKEKYSSLGIMLSHCIFPTVDSCPVSLSHLWHQETTLRFCENLYTDCLDMKGVGPFLNKARLQYLKGYKIFSTLRGHFCESYLS